jgi:hypothetical protein
MAFRAFTNSDSMCFKLTKLPSPYHDIQTTVVNMRLRQLARLFAKIRVSECNGDSASIMRCWRVKPTDLS